MNLAKTQLLSIFTKGITTTLGLAQTFIVVRVLSVEEFGLIGLIMSIGGIVGVTQHLGVVDGAIREIAVLKEKNKIGKAQWVSHIIRQAVTIPLSIGLTIAASFIAAKIYGRPEITPYIQLFGIILILQGLQDVLGATLTGIKSFGSLYITQIITAVINIIAFGFLTWRYGVGGFFWAIIFTTTIMVVMFALIIFNQLSGHLKLPTLKEIRAYSQLILKVSAYMYVSRILFIVWQKLPILMLGGILAAKELGFLNVALGFGSRLTIIAMALSEVNLSWMSTLFANQREQFTKTVERNMHRVLVFLASVTLIILFFGPDILMLIKPEYNPARSIILVITLAFFIYSLLDVGTSSVFVSANKSKIRAALFGIMSLITGATMLWLYLTTPSATYAALGVLFGVVVSYIGMISLAHRHFKVSLLTRQLSLLLLLVGLVTIWLLLTPALTWRIVVFVLLVLFIGWEINRSNLLPKFRSATYQPSKYHIICFAGASFNAPTWTNRQQIMSRVSNHYPVLYVEPRIWIIRFVVQNILHPSRVFTFLKKIFWYQQVSDNFFVKSQWNLLPGSREYKIVAKLNHLLNKWNTLLVVHWLGFKDGNTVMWVYDTEAAEYLSSFNNATVVYDCVDDHAAQAGVSRNAERVRSEENIILRRANLVTTTSNRLFQQKKGVNINTHLVLNAGDVKHFSRVLSPIPIQTNFDHKGKPILGSVGALDSYKYNFDMLQYVAEQRPDWTFVFIGAPVVDQHSKKLKKLTALPNVHVMGTVDRQQVPALVASFDVCLIPYRSNQYNLASFPLKFWEFMATGKPIITSGLPELEPYEDLISIVNTPQEFLRAAEHSLATLTLGAEKRRQLAFNHSWEHRVQQLLDLLNMTLKNNKR